MAHYPAPRHPANSQWFLDGEGIEQRVVLSDIPRMLGNDATVRRGSGPAGRMGYIYSAYRPLTPAMIQSLKEDSQRYNYERSQNYGRGSDSLQRSNRARTESSPTEPVAPASGYYTTSPQYIVPAEYRNRLDGYGRDDTAQYYGRAGASYAYETGGAQSAAAGGPKYPQYRDDRDSDTTQRQQYDEGIGGYRVLGYPYRAHAVGKPEAPQHPQNRQMATPDYVPESGPTE
ncbi:hypothetical protein K440DRAFT_643423 [Wilcoxina mikolae CBS 423.85]|nr:hypothetical protein K440DRAFT_643423 [Wilcoxina mikolae CBS 423.85]